MKKPILVTGIHRSGTTWVGKMLSASNDVAYISEPLNVHHRPGILFVPTKHWYTYISNENQSLYFQAFQDTIRFRYHPWLEIKSLRSIKDFGRMFRDIGRTLKGRIFRTRPLLKDPFAVFSAPWFAHRLGCQVVIVVRHPLAFVSSLKRLNWEFDFQDLLDQPLLMQDHLEPFRDEMQAFPKDTIAQGSVLWRMVYTVVNRFRYTYPEFILVRHEDLSRRPEETFQKLYESVGLEYTNRVRKVVVNSSHLGNPDELSSQRIHAVKLDSQANLSNWKNRLSKQDVIQIRRLTFDMASEFYPEDTWK
jgi:hypothetical protein